MPGTRVETLVNQECLIGFRHIYDGVLTDVDQMLDVKILDPDTLAVIHTIPGNQVQHIGLGAYQALIPANILNRRGQWRDAWHIVPVPSSGDRTFNFTINVSVIPAAQQPPTLASITGCTIADLDCCMIKKSYLWPVWSVLANGYYLSDHVLQHHIDTSISWMQRHLGMPLQRTRVRTRPFEGNQNLVLGTDYEEEGRLIQWDVSDSIHWSSIRLPVGNIIRVNSVRGVYGGRVVYSIPNEWVDANNLSNGIVRVRPTTTGAVTSLIDGSGQFLDVTLLESIGHNFVPGFWAVDYEYGLNESIPKEICDVIMKKASVLILDQIGQSIGRGLSQRSASVDGLSSTIGTVANAERTMFGALARRYEEELTPETLVDLRRFYKGMTVFLA